MEDDRLSPRFMRTPSWENMMEPLTLTKDQYKAALAAVMEEYSKGKPPMMQMQPAVGEMKKAKKIAAPKVKPTKGCSKL